jgi:hypothetical protein
MIQRRAVEHALQLAGVDLPATGDLAAQRPMLLAPMNDRMRPAASLGGCLYRRDRFGHRRPP